MDRWNQRVVKREQCSHTNMSEGLKQIQKNSAQSHTNISKGCVQIQENSEHTDITEGFVQIQHMYKRERTASVLMSKNGTPTNMTPDWGYDEWSQMKSNYTK